MSPHSTLSIILCLLGSAVAAVAAEPECIITGTISNKNLPVRGDATAGLPITLTVYNPSKRTLRYRIGHFDVFLYRNTWCGWTRKNAFPFDPTECGSHRLPSAYKASPGDEIEVTLPPGTSYSHAITVPRKYLIPLGKSIVAALRMQDVDNPHVKWEACSKPFRIPDLK